MNLWLHVLPETDGISSTISPCDIITGVKLDHHKHCVIPFGAYYKNHKEHEKSLYTKTIVNISLPQTGNGKVGHYSSDYRQVTSPTIHIGLILPYHMKQIIGCNMFHDTNIRLVFHLVSAMMKRLLRTMQLMSETANTMNQAETTTTTPMTTLIVMTKIPLQEWI